MTRFYLNILIISFLFLFTAPINAIELPDFTELAEKYSPSVVNILSEKEFKEFSSFLSVFYVKSLKNLKHDLEK